MQISSATASLLTTPLPTSGVEPGVLAAAQIAAEPTASDGSPAPAEISVETVEADEEAPRHDGLTHRESKALLRDAEDAAKRSLHAYAREHHGEDRHLMRDTKHALRDFRHEVRAAHRDLHHGEVDGEGFVAEVRTAFEGLATALGVTETPEPAPVLEPVVESAREEVPVAPAPVETEAQDPGAALREMMQALRERFDAVVGELESLLGVAAEDEAPASELEAVVAGYAELDVETDEDTTGSVVDLEA